MTALLLTPNEARVLAALVEKSLTTPQYYPMTVNALMMASNQKNSRDPVMTLSEGDVGAALNRLDAERLAQRDDLAGRVPKWRHRFQHQLLLKPETMAVLATLMLRGPQTPAELRANAAALAGPADAEGVAAALADLADRAQPFAMPLSRAPGQAATRYVHLLCGEPDAQATGATTEPQARSGSSARHSPISAQTDELVARVAALEERLATLEKKLEGLI